MGATRRATREAARVSTKPRKEFALPKPKALHPANLA